MVSIKLLKLKKVLIFSPRLRLLRRSPTKTTLLYPRLAGMTGTAKTEEVEFEKTYKLETTIIPTNRPRSRQDWPDQVYKTEEAKWRAVAREIVDINKSGRPILVGTTSVEKSELLSSLLQETHTEHNLLNAKPEYVERESEIVAQAVFWCCYYCY